MAVRIELPRQDNTQYIYYPTGSWFKGTINEFGMQDWGIYTYPDGTKYSGQFRNNRFHGIGTIELAAPHCVNFGVLHRHGKLIEIQSVSFNDNLPVEFDLKDDEMTFDNWNYCTAKERRFCPEKTRPVEPVGPFKFKSREGPNPPPLRRNIFDLGFGKFNRRGCVTGMPQHMSETPEFHVDCPEIREWIKDNCRHGELTAIEVNQEKRAQFAREIMENNLETERKFLKVDEESQWPKKSASFQSEKEIRLCSSEFSESDSSNLEQEFYKLPEQTCENCLSQITKEKPEGEMELDMEMESEVCLIN